MHRVEPSLNWLIRGTCLAAVLICSGIERCSLASDDPTRAETPRTLPPASERQVDFGRDIQPIFQRACYSCHGPGKQQSGYRLDARETALNAGDAYAPNIVPGRSADSPLIQFVAGTGDVRMPPEEGKRLTDDEVGLLRAWIDRGANWPAELSAELPDTANWWAFQPLQRPDWPAYQDHRTRQPLDVFVGARLAEEGLEPVPPADRGPLLRRLYFDLIGLPPAPDDVAEFAADPRPDACERWVDKLLASPRYGERWARHWLDAAHFAETHGHDQDRVREHAWPYRDYLIDALNSDLPYDRFVQEQVAGDVLFPDDPQGIVALGFLAAGPWDESSLRDIREDTIDRQIARYLDRDDVVATVMNTFVSLTVQCARCHDHKFDPISQRDYYALQAVFAGVDRANRVFDPDPEVHRRRRDLLHRKALLAGRDPELLAALLSPENELRVADWERRRRVEWTVLDACDLSSSEGATLTKRADGSVVSTGLRPERDTYTAEVSSPLPRITAVRLEVLTDDSLPQHGPGRQENGNLHLSEFELYVSGQESPLPFARATSDFDQAGWGIARANDQQKDTAWGIFPQVGQPHVAVFELREPLSPMSATRLRFALHQLHGGGHLIGRFRLSVTDQNPPLPIDLLPESIVATMQVPRAQRTPSQRQELAVFLCQEELEQALAALPLPARVYAAASDFEPDGSHKPTAAPRLVQVLHRGDIHQPRELAQPGALTLVRGLPARFTAPELQGLARASAGSNSQQEGWRRAALARWLTDRRNPLTWRSAVNRVWHHHFGQGLVTSVNDFGHMGDLPSHPALLDWLAADLRDEGQSLKNLHRRIVTSATYRQASQGLTQQSAVDASNRWLWRMPRTRLDAECIRDSVLAVSDRLDLRMGGPSDRQFDLQPGIHVTPKVDYSKFDLDSRAGRRRSVYRFLFRTLPDPFLDTLDCPSGESLTPVRHNSVTVQQALAVWNNSFVVRQCEHTAARLEAVPGSLSERVERLVWLAFARGPSKSELSTMSQYAEEHGLANLTRVLFNSNEFLFVN